MNLYTVRDDDRIVWMAALAHKKALDPGEVLSVAGVNP